MRGCTTKRCPRRTRPRGHLCLCAALPFVLQLCFHLTQTSFELAGVVPAEQQLPAGRQYGAKFGSGPAAVAAVGGGQLGAGERSRHRDLPPSRRRNSRRPRSCCDHRWPTGGGAGARWLHSCRRAAVRQCSRAEWRRSSRRITRLPQRW